MRFLICWIVGVMTLVFGSATSYADIYNEEGDLLHSADPIVVTLGCDCMIALQLRAANLRSAAFPFDWNFSFIIDRVVELLDEDFEHYLSPNYLCLKKSEVINTRYTIEFKHDGQFFDPGSGKISNEIYDKYQRRIARFRALKNYPGKVIFMRSAFDYHRFPFHDYGDERMGKIDAKEAEALRDALARYFPNLNFVLVVVNYDRSLAAPISGIDRVIEYRISSYHKRKSYERILTELLSPNLFP
ncbi:MAG: hypothetical protein HYX48_06495 [Chlamydiales bacterium]|nr:hypothetical protein [Chlamydiales bacterium]